MAQSPNLGKSSYFLRFLRNGFKMLKKAIISKKSIRNVLEKKTFGVAGKRYRIGRKAFCFSTDLLAS